MTKALPSLRMLQVFTCLRSSFANFHMRPHLQMYQGCILRFE